MRPSSNLNTIKRHYEGLFAISAIAWAFIVPAFGQDGASSPGNAAPAGSSTNSAPALDQPASEQEQKWNWHVQNTDIVDWHPDFPAKYSGPNSLNHQSEVQNSESLDLTAGARLWHGAELHVDGLMWQGFGFSKTLGAEGFPNGEAFRLGAQEPNVVFPRVFLRQTIGLGGDTELIEDDAFHLAGNVDVNRVTLTVGKMSAKDIFDNNAYANDPRTQFFNWSFMANEAWDYPADSLGFETGFAAELNVPQWTLRYGFFQMPRVSNGLATDPAYLRAWAMVTELERRFAINSHPGTVRLLAFLNRAHMGSYQEVVDNPALNGNIAATRAYRYKYGFGLNVEQEVAKGVGVFSRVGWSDGRNEAWAFSDVDHTASLGLSVNGGFWHRTNDTFAVAGALNGISGVHQAFFAMGGTGILAGDGNLTYGMEQVLETYYDILVYKSVHCTLDYQFIDHPAFNRDRGPVSVFSARLHWEF